jgi:hypothetical protein
VRHNDNCLRNDYNAKDFTNCNGVMAMIPVQPAEAHAYQWHEDFIEITWEVPGIVLTFTMLGILVTYFETIGLLFIR